MLWGNVQHDDGAGLAVQEDHSTGLISDLSRTL